MYGMEWASSDWPSYLLLTAIGCIIVMRLLTYGNEGE